jgi:hypothetical protein
MNKTIYLDGEHYTKAKRRKIILSHFKTFTAGLILGGCIMAFYQQSAPSPHRIDQKCDLSVEQRSEILRDGLQVVLNDGLLFVPVPERKPEGK